MYSFVCFRDIIDINNEDLSRRLKDDFICKLREKMGELIDLGETFAGIRENLEKHLKNFEVHVYPYVCQFCNTLTDCFSRLVYNSYQVIPEDLWSILLKNCF